ncbi:MULTISPECIES: MerR family transcriptional regulator [Bacillaceae]|uniref:MerR family transcriptional regulator n=1 Tax=Bacillaceae TaxID=186817 RepID=UPI001E2E9D2A|nr:MULTISPECIES: MerR family transcriptional regulator [Bacillaceae]MCE4049305.1 MerR family transcriptional regulator [Bacillus sp. Au-Bac7]MCM3033582.1 MerR family transcriptional regulator [Niallia sp. MER 6]UPO90275.1 MerR family transcriptional regulator [Niallia sp. Man26]
MNWKINEIANLYDISAHTLRYYEEINLVVPSRGENNYRIYTDEHLQQLNIIRDLRKFNIPLEEIKDYLEKRTVEKTLNLLKKQQNFLEQELAALQEMQHIVEERIDLFTHTAQMSEGECQVIEYPDRYVIASNDKDTDGEHVDLSLKELYKKYENNLPYLEQQMIGSFLYVKTSTNSINHRVFYYIENDSDPNTMIIPKGKYASTCYKGNYKKTQQYITKLKEYIKTNNYTADGHLFETYLIDFHETHITEEYVTRMEVRIKDPI